MSAMREGVTAVPLVSWVQAGNPSEIAEAYTRKSPDAWVTTSRRVSRSAYALRVKGGSMTNPTGRPTFPDGTIIIVDPNVPHLHGSLVVVRFDDENEATFKRYEEDGAAQFLVPLNPAYKVIQIDRPAAFCGVVVSRAEEDVA